MTSARVKLVVVMMLMTYCSKGVCAQLLKGDPGAAQQESFSVPITHYISDYAGEGLFVGTKANEEYSLSWIRRDRVHFMPLALKSVNLNNETSVSNPLYNADVLYLSLFQEKQDNGGVIQRPVVVSAFDPTRIFYIENFINSNNIIMFSTAQLLDAQNAITSGIVGLGVNNQFAFAAVKAQGAGQFGSVGSGIALATCAQMTIQEKQENETVERTVKAFSQVNVSEGNPVGAIPLDVSSEFIKITQDLASMDFSDMVWSYDLGRLYLALNVTGAAGMNDGARSIAVGRIEYIIGRDDKSNQTSRPIFKLDKIVDSSVFVAGDNDAIIGAVGADVQVSVHKIRILRTSTLLNYLIVLGDVGAPGDTQKSLYALPLVNNPSNPEQHGSLASVSAVPQDQFFNGKIKTLQNRLLPQAVQANADLVKNTNMAAQIGGGVLPAGTINDMYAFSDAVFIAVGDADPNNAPGTYVSTALFDDLGKIKGWTAWQRVGGSVWQSFGVSYDPQYGDVIAFNGDAADNIKTVMRSYWSTGNEDSPLQQVSSLCSQEFAKDQGGVQGLYDFPVSTPTFQGVSWLVATGLKKILIVESGQTNAGVFEPNGYDFNANVLEFTNGTISINLPAPGTTPLVLALSGGALEDLGPITACQVASAGMQGYFVVGGVHGIAILVDPMGNGWAQVGNNFQGLTQGMTFKKIGDYSYIRAFVADEEYLYVLTDQVLDRIDLAASNFATGQLSVVRLANRDEAPLAAAGSFLDVVVSKKLALIATSMGLFRSGDGVNIADAAVQGVADVKWTQVSLPQALQPISYLVPLAHNGTVTSLTERSGGTVYVVSSDIGNNRSRLSRISIKGLQGADQVDATTVTPLNDIFIQGSPSYFANLSGFRNIFATDGSVRFMAVDKDLKQPASMLVLPPDLTTGYPIVSYSSKPLPINDQLVSNIVRFTRNSASGSWLIAGDFGLFLNE